MNSGAPEVYTVPVPLVTPVLLLLIDTNNKKQKGYTFNYRGEGEIKLRWSTIPPISIKLTITSHHKSTASFPIYYVTDTSDLVS